MSDRLGRINVLRTMIGICVVAMPALYAAGSNVALLYAAVFVDYWCYGTQLSANGVAADFWGTKNAGVNYGILFTAWGTAGISGRASTGCCMTGFTTTRRRFTPPLPLRAWRWCANWAPGGLLEAASRKVDAACYTAWIDPAGER
jgi:hypothetical protein